MKNKRMIFWPGNKNHGKIVKVIRELELPGIGELYACQGHDYLNDCVFEDYPVMLIEATGEDRLAVGYFDREYGDVTISVVMRPMPARRLVRISSPTFGTGES